MICLDTSAIIDIFRKNLKIINLIKGLNEDLCSTIINYQEIMFGLDLENIKYVEEENFFDNFFEGILFFNLDKKTCKQTSKLYWGLKRDGKMIEEFDCTIAGILLANGVDKIITKNIKHFENIRGLKVIGH